MINKPPVLHLVMLIDEWFPHEKRQVGSFGGTQVHVRELKKYLEAKHQCTVVLFYQSHPNLIIKFLWPFLAFIDVLLYSRYHRIHLVHAHGNRSALPAKLISLVLKIPVIQTVHGSNYLDQGKQTPSAWWEKLVLTKIPYTTQITISKNFLKYPNVNHDIRVISNGVNLPEFNAVKVKKNSFPTVIWVGRDDPSKGLDILKKAIAKIRKVMPALHAELVADGRLSGRELIKAYKRAHLFALSSLAEGQPITLLEAWAARLPVVVTNVGDNALMVKDGVNGYLVEAGNTQQLAAAIRKVLRSRDQGSHLGENGYQYVKDNFSWQKVAKQTYECYNQALTSGTVKTVSNTHNAAAASKSYSS